MDYFPQAGQFHAGGNSLNQAIQFRRHGLESFFMGALGTDEPGDRIAELLHRATVDTSRMQRLQGETASNTILVDEKGERSGAEGAWRSGVYAQFRLSESDWQFINQCDVIATHADCPDYQVLLSRVRAGPLVTVDFLHLDDYDLMRKSAGTVNIVFSGGHAGMIDGLQQVAKDTNLLVVLTLGADGGMAFLGDSVYTQDALPLDRVVDTTGCGDAFQAAFTCEYLQSGDIQDSLMEGAHAGKIAAGRYGAAEWLQAT